MKTLQFDPKTPINQSLKPDGGAGDEKELPQLVTV